MVDVVNLGKRFGHFQAVKELSFSLTKGTVLGFIGPNGAGKTTTMRMLTGYIPPSSGSIHINGLNIVEHEMQVRSIVGYLPETPPLYRELSIGAYLSFVAGIRSVSNPKYRIAEVMEEVGLVGWENKIISSLSKGYKQRVGLAQAIIHNPKLLILDEPTSGLDPRQMVGVRRFIKRLSEERTVILSTHILSQLEDICNQMLIVQKGTCVAQGTPQQIKSYAGGGRVHLCFGGRSSQYLTDLKQHAAVDSLSLFSEEGETCTIEVFSQESNIQRLMFQFAKEKDWNLWSLYEYQPSLEDVFLAIVGEEV